MRVQIISGEAVAEGVEPKEELRARVIKDVDLVIDRDIREIERMPAEIVSVSHLIKYGGVIERLPNGLLRARLRYRGVVKYQLPHSNLVELQGHMLKG